MEEKAEKILKVATQEFATSGYHRTKMETIAEKAEVSKGLVFHYFKSKKKLYTTAITVAIETLQTLFDYDKFPKESLLSLFEYSLALKFSIAKSHEFEMGLMIEVYSHLETLPSDLQKDIMAYIEETTQTSYRIIASIIRQMPIKEEFTEEEVVKLVLMVFNQIELEAKAKMQHEPISELSQFDELIKETSQQMKILEQGFLKKSN